MHVADTIHPVILTVAESDRQLRGRSKVRTLSVRARIALADSARWADMELGTLAKDARGAPLPCEGIHWSVTHKSDFVAAVAARSPVGIDLERRQPVSQALYTRLAGPDEWRLGGVRDEALFLRYWTAKEAVLKAVGQGLAGLARCRIEAILNESYLKVVYESDEWLVAQCPIGATHLAAVTLCGEAVEWHLPVDGVF